MAQDTATRADGRFTSHLSVQLMERHESWQYTSPQKGSYSEPAQAESLFPLAEDALPTEVNAGGAGVLSPTEFNGVKRRTISRVVVPPVARTPMEKE